MKKNFTNNEKNILESVVKSISPVFTVEFNKAGNLTVRNSGTDVWWTLYRSDVNNGKLVWRRLWKDYWGGYRSHLLNCRGRKTMKSSYGTWTYKSWDGVNAHAVMDSFLEAMTYAKTYFSNMKEA
jgi:hypothetical protein